VVGVLALEPGQTAVRGLVVVQGPRGLLPLVAVVVEMLLHLGVPKADPVVVFVVAVVSVRLMLGLLISSAKTQSCR
jgi:hypothetical protein